MQGKYVNAQIGLINKMDTDINKTLVSYLIYDLNRIILLNKNKKTVEEIETEMIKTLAISIQKEPKTTSVQELFVKYSLNLRESQNLSEQSKSDITSNLKGLPYQLKYLDYLNDIEKCHGSLEEKTYLAIFNESDIRNTRKNFFLFKNDKEANDDVTINGISKLEDIYLDLSKKYLTSLLKRFKNYNSLPVNAILNIVSESIKNDLLNALEFQDDQSVVCKIKICSAIYVLSNMFDNSFDPLFKEEAEIRKKCEVDKLTYWEKVIDIIQKGKEEQVVR